MDYWKHQTTEPLYPDVIWSRPETKHSAGKLLIIGGSAGNMSNLAANFAASEHSGAGTIYLLVPDSLAKVTKGIPHIQYAASNPSGSFAKSALDEFLSIGESVDGVYLAGDIGKNSETSLLLEAFLTKQQGVIAISSDSIESFASGYTKILIRPKTIVELTLNQLREVGIELKLERAITSDIGRAQLAESLHDMSQNHPATFIIRVRETTWVTQNGQVVDCANNNSFAKCVVWAIQQPEKQFEAIVSSLYD